MRSKGLKWTPVVIALALAVVMMPSAVAQCGLSSKLVRPSSWSPSLGGAHLMRAAFGDSGENNAAPSIVGMWHVVFTANAMNGTPIGDMVIDNAVVVWHSDGTEIMNSSRPAQDGNFCLGVWTRTGKLNYTLNHIAWMGNDIANAPDGIGNPQAGAQIGEQVTLTPDGNSYSGTFKLDAYDGGGNLAVSFTGAVTATRITTDTSITSLF